jgi:hypothetical protein
MLKQRLGVIHTLVHERLVLVDINEETQVLGYAFGADGPNIIVCFRKLELEAAGMRCDGPCVNRFYPSAKIKFLDSSKVPVAEIEEEEDEPDIDPDRGSDTDSTSDLLDDADAEDTKKKKGKKQRKIKVKKGK